MRHSQPAGVAIQEPWSGHRGHSKRGTVVVVVLPLIWCGGSTLWFSRCRSSASSTPAARGAKQCSASVKGAASSLVKVSTLSAGVRVVTERRKQAFTPWDHGLAGGEFSRRRWYGENAHSGRIGMLVKNRVCINPFCPRGALWKPWHAEAPAWL